MCFAVELFVAAAVFAVVAHVFAAAALVFLVLAAAAMAYSATYRPRPLTDVFTADTDINRRNCTRTVPMKVLILGLGRTGTACPSRPPPLFRRRGTR